ncbi:MAG: TldD/PmbA family protein, partial [Myxococcota bacterium]|nr:TldD/PmbA family protein [Myxococcota bacterium]
MELNQTLLPTDSQYVELRKHRVQMKRLSMIDGNILQNSTDETHGLNARVFHQGCWGCAASPFLTATNAEKIGRIAKDNARSLMMFGEPKKLAAGSVRLEHLSERKPAWSAAEKIDFLHAINDIAIKKYPRLQSTSLMLIEEHHEKELINSYDAHTKVEIARSMLYLNPTMLNRSQEPIALFDILDGRGFIADLDLTMEKVEQRLEQLYLWLLDKTEAVPARAGKVDCILGSGITGILAHEALGHPCEADLVLSGSVTSNLVGERVASDLITMVDFAHTYNDTLLPVPVLADDEGVEAKDVVMVEKGILKGFMNNRETAEEMGVAPTGNARGYMFEDEPLIRMRNTLILPGTSNLEDMIADVEDGYLLLKTANGQADTTTEFMFGIQL